MFEISQKDFAILSQFVQKNYGINLSHKKSLIENRLTSTLVHDGYQNFSDYVRHITEEHPAQDIDIMLQIIPTLCGNQNILNISNPPSFLGLSKQGGIKPCVSGAPDAQAGKSPIHSP